MFEANISVLREGKFHITIQLLCLEHSLILRMLFEHPNVQKSKIRTKLKTIYIYTHLSDFIKSLISRSD